MHRILLREVVIDVPSKDLPATREFWAAALLAEAHVVATSSGLCYVAPAAPG